jgi:hypothetical protein
MKYCTKTLFTLFITCFVITQTQSQIVTVNKVTDFNIRKIIPNIKSYTHINSKELGISIVEVTNETGSANLGESEEVTSDLYIGVSEADENPRQNCFQIKNLYGINNVRLEKSETTDAILSFYYFDLHAKMHPKKQVKIRVNLDKAVVL